MSASLQLPERRRVLGLPVSAVDLSGTVAVATEAIRTRRPLRIAVTNHNKCWLAQRDPVLRRFLEDADLVVAESSMVWAARTLGHDGVGAAWGVALMGALLGEADAAGWRVYFLGAQPGVVAELVARVGADRPGVRVAGWHHGYLAGDDEARVREEIRRLAPDLLFVAMGSPKQEAFLATLGREGPTVAVGVGGSFDVHAGRKPDAPAWVRGSGLEWLYRAALDPRLLKRYVRVLPWFVLAVVRERVTGRTP